MYLHLFRAGGSDLFAATADSRGQNLPALPGKDPWRYIRGATVMPTDSPTLALDPATVVAGVERCGYHLWGREAPAAPQSAEPTPNED